MMSIRKFVALFFFLTISNVLSQVRNFEDIINLRAEQAYKYLIANISRSDTPKGFIVASPSKVDPDYYYHWVRDAALVMRSLSLILPTNNQFYLRQVNQYASLESNHQKISKLSDQGEPKFNPDGTSFKGPWGRPQNDGPALRSAYFSNIALAKAAKGDLNYLKKFYAPNLPARSLLKIDFEYVSHKWNNPDFDLWEEIQGQHFYTRMVQHHSLKLAAEVATISKDIGAKSWYLSQSEKIENSLNDHVKEDKIIRATVKRVGGLDSKHSQLDSSVILAVLHTDRIEGHLSITSEEIQKTFITLDQTFKKLYPINQKKVIRNNKNRYLPTLATAIGRYPEDSFFGGNPWYLLTSTFAEYCYRQAAFWKKQSSTSQFNSFHKKSQSMISKFLNLRGNPSAQDFYRAWKNKGDQYLARVLYHVDDAGHQAEQMDKVNGHFKGANDLTWSYAAYLSAVHHRKLLQKQNRR